jgi:hygromycin-B 7''-O-kinase
MKKNNATSLLPVINSFEEYEKFKSNTTLLEKIAQVIINRHQLANEPLALFTEGTNIVFAHGKHTVIKIFPPIHNDSFQTEKIVLQHLQDKLSIATPKLEHVGEIAGWPYLIMTRLQGTLLEELWKDLNHGNKIIIMQELGALIREMHALPTQGLETIDCHWQAFIEQQITQCVTQHSANKLPENLLQQLPDYLKSVKEFLPKIRPPALLTGEYTPMNLVVKKISGVWHINGLIDFGDCMLGMPEYDLLGPGAFLIQGDKQLLKEFLIAYGYTTETMTPALSRCLTALMLLHRYSNLNIQIRIANWQSKVSTLNELEQLVWGL